MKMQKNRCCLLYTSVVRSLNEITDDIYDLEEFVKTITDMGIWLYSLEVGPVPITVSHAEDFGC